MTAEAHKGRRGPSGGFYFGPRREGDERTLGEHLTALLDDGLVTARKAEYEATRGSGEGAVAKKRIGAGYIGTECGRALAFKFHKAPVEERPSVVSPGALQRHAEAGHWTEDSTAEWLRLAGFELLTEKLDDQGQPIIGHNGKPLQHGFKAARDRVTGQFQLAGEVDGIITRVPDALIYQLGDKLPMVWESKKATAKKFKAFSSKGVKAADPKYHGQVQTTMAYMDIRFCLFSMLNLDNMDYYWELIAFDGAVAQQLTDRAVRILESQSPEEMPRITADPNDFRCKFCDYKDRCWSSSSEPAGSGVPKPSWLQSDAASPPERSLS